MASNTDTFRLNAPLFSTTLNGPITSSTTTVVLESVANLPTGTGIDLVIDAVSPSTNKPTPSLQETVTGVVSTGSVSLINCLRGVEGSAQAHSTGANVYGYVTASSWNALINGLLTQHVQGGGHSNITATSIVNSGTESVAGLLSANGGLSVATGQAFTATNAIQSVALALSNALDGTNGVQSYSNSGNAGGTGYYINLGGIKLCWGKSNNLSSYNTPVYTVNYPSSFFSTIQSVSLSINSVGTDVEQGAAPSSSASASGFTYYAFSSANSTAATQSVGWLAIGT